MRLPLLTDKGGGLRKQEAIIEKVPGRSSIVECEAEWRSEWDRGTDSRGHCSVNEAWWWYVGPSTWERNRTTGRRCSGHVQQQAASRSWSYPASETRRRGGGTTHRERDIERGEVTHINRATSRPGWVAVSTGRVVVLQVGRVGYGSAHLWARRGGHRFGGCFTRGGAHNGCILPRTGHSGGQQIEVVIGGFRCDRAAPLVRVSARRRRYRFHGRGFLVLREERLRYWQRIHIGHLHGGAIGHRWFLHQWIVVVRVLPRDQRDVHIFGEQVEALIRLGRTKELGHLMLRVPEPTHCSNRGLGR